MHGPSGPSLVYEAPMRTVLLALIAAAALVAGPAARAAGDVGAEAASSYRIETEGTTRALKPGGAGKLVLAIVPRSGTHVHPEAPLKIALSGSAGLALAKTALGHADA